MTPIDQDQHESHSSKYEEAIHQTGAPPWSRIRRAAYSRSPMIDSANHRPVSRRRQTRLKFATRAGCALRQERSSSSRKP